MKRVKLFLVLALRFFSVLRQACMTFTGFYSMDDSYVYYRLGLLPIIIGQSSKRPGQVVVFFANGQGLEVQVVLKHSH